MGEGLKALIVKKKGHFLFDLFSYKNKRPKQPPRVHSDIQRLRSEIPANLGVPISAFNFRDCNPYFLQLNINLLVAKLNKYKLDLPSSPFAGNFNFWFLWSWAEVEIKRLLMNVRVVKS